MDDLYGDLENYNEENTISELKVENEELKSKLEEYAATLSKLQKDFDVLSSEYKKLETNYSSLLKTAKAEIERKTQIITNLNLEKDKMVLMSYQNRNIRPYQARSRENPILPQNKIDLNEKKSVKDKIKQIEGKRKLPPHLPTEKKEQDNLPSRDTSASHIELRSKLLSLSNSVNQHDPRTEKNTKENIMHDKKEASATIRNRRKSMPALSVEKEQFSTDDDDVVARTVSKDQKVNSDHNFQEKQKHIDNFQDRPKSRISDTSSLEERKSGHHETISDSHKHRSSRYDREPTDRYRTRHKSSHRYKRQSPDRYSSGPREFHDNYYHRSESDRHRLRGRVPESPPREKYQRHSREIHRNYERSQYHEHDRLPHRSQERYSTKRRIEHGYDEADSKRARMEPQSKHHEVDEIMYDDNMHMDKKYFNDPLEIQFSSCESPDYDNLEVSHQQVREIKLTAVTKLDDPRISSKKYILKNDNGKSTLRTVAGQHVDILPVSKVAWGINPVSIPEALVKMPTLEKDLPAENICKEIENPADISMESGEIDDHEDVNSHNNLHDKNKESILSSERKITPVPVPKVDETKNIEKSLQKINSYKIPKLKKTADDKQSLKNTKEITSAKKQVHEITDLQYNKDSNFIKNIDINKQLLQLAKGKTYNQSNKYKQTKCFAFHSNSHQNVTVPFIDSSDACERKNPTAQEVVEGDLEMSDDNCDEDEQSDKVIVEKTNSSDLAKKTVENPESFNIDKEKQSTDALEKATLEALHKDKTTVTDSKKNKSKKKSKHKEIKGTSKGEDSTKDFEKPAKKKEKEKVMKSTHIKTKFSELFDDSSSLINPEDLGVAAAPATTTTLPDKCVPFSEDAVDATDLKTIKPATVNNFIPPKKSMNEENQAHSYDPVMDICDPVNKDSDEKIDSIRSAICDEDIESIYKNLEPGVSEQEENVQTIVISTGVQPPVLLKNGEEVVASKLDLPVKAKMQDVALEALATSTPHKLWQLNAVPADTDSKLPDASCDSNTESQMVSVDNTAVMDKSDNNTMDSQTSEGNVPDVRIFVKRRRKVAKK